MSGSEVEDVRYVSYWETAPGHSMPPYTALALVSIQRALGEKFLLLTGNCYSRMTVKRTPC